MDDLTLSLIKDNNVASDVYGIVVNKLIRKKYSESQVEAILNNYLDDSTNEKYKAEFDALQTYRKECKTSAKAMLGLEV